jgi:transposase
LLVDRREDLVAQRTSTMNRFWWRVHELDPTRCPMPLHSIKPRQALGAWLDSEPGLIAELAREELEDINRQTEQIKAMTKRIQVRVRAVAPTLLARQAATS